METEKQEISKFPTIEEQKAILGEMGLSRYYKKIDKVLRDYMDLKEEYYSLVALWIIGSYFHKQFSSYPYLFFNAMKGSGKTRLLNIIANLSKNGNVANSMTEAVLFRTAYNRTLCIDELETINSKGNENLGLLINSAYKKGSCVERMVKKKTLEGEQQIPEKFKVYCPIAMANIKGLENILSDRCIMLILEKSSNPDITRLIENFENDSEFKEIRGGLLRLTEKISDDLNYFGNVFDEWNSICKKEKKTPEDKYKELFSKIDKTTIQGRDLELFLPLFIIADICGKSILDKTLEFSLKIVRERRQQDREENIDIKIYEFVAQLEDKGFITITKLLEDFKEFSDMRDDWLSHRFFGRGLRRLNLVISERHSNRRQVRLDLDKAKTKFKMFKFPEQIDFSELDEVI